VQITVAETVGVEARGGYFDTAGALRDMAQNHLLQVLCLMAMEPPITFDADEVRNKKVDVLRAIPPIHGDEVHRMAVRGQYRKGTVLGEAVPGYREEKRVAPDSNTEIGRPPGPSGSTIAGMRLFGEMARNSGLN